MDPWLVLSVVASLPVAAYSAVTAGVAATTYYAVRRGRREHMDPFQERLFLGRPRLTAAARGRGLLSEGFWQTVAFGLQGAHMVRRFTPPPARSEGGPVVLLIAGYMENGGQMWPLARRLAARGFQPVIVDFPSTLRSIQDNVAYLATEVERVRAAVGVERVALVGHSMGGVISRAYVHATPDAPAACVVSLCSPHRGTHLARLGPGASARDMRVGSPHMRAHPPQRRTQVPVHTLISVQDNIVSPAWSTVLIEGENQVLDRPVGHVAPLFLPEVAAQVTAWLEAADFDAPVQAATTADATA
jgi:pimeloyl-ACP methyl ester carboxylesterase